MRHTATLRVIPCLCLLLGCVPETPREQDAPEMTAPAPDATSDLTTPQVACPTPLTLTPAPAYVNPLGLLTLRVEGGSGAHAFELVDNASGALLNKDTGAFLAGNKPFLEDASLTDVVDRVRVVDTDCVGQAELDVNVVAEMAVAPREISLQPGDTFTFDVSQGSGTYAFDTMRDASQGSLSEAGVYVAGAELGIDRLEVRDVETGQAVEVTVRVQEETTLRAEPSVLFLPVGATYPLRTTGGSGLADAALSGDGVRLSDGAFVAEAPGSVDVTLTDRFLPDRVARMRVQVVPALTASERLDGELGSTNRVLSDVDINGDGFKDAVLAYPDASVDAYRSGALFIYEGSATGLKPDPARVISGQERSEDFAFDVAIRDLDGDGAPELLVSSRLADLGAADAGAVFLYKGESGAFFSEDPAVTWSGEFAGDQFGHAVTICDVNGDDRPDIAVGIPLGEDRDASPVRSNQGGIKVFLNYEEGWLPKADQSVWGKLPDTEGVYANTADLRLGQALASADVDGDGRCDVVAGTTTYNASRGLLAIFPGKAPDMLGPGGIAGEPAKLARLDSTATTSPNFARRLAAGDLDGDGKAEVAIGSYTYDPSADNGDVNRGAVFLIPGQTLEPSTTYLTEADMTRVGMGNNRDDQMGWQVEIADVNGDDKLDLLTTARIDELPDNPGAAGVVRVYYGNDAPLVADAEADVAVTGKASSDFLGQGMWPGGDLNQDGTPEIVAFSARADRQGLDVGDLYTISLEETPVFTEHEIPLSVSGDQIGRAVRFVGDLNGDGAPELAVGAIRQSPMMGTQTDAGVVSLYESVPGGYAATPAQELESFFTHSVTDFFGRGVSTAGDFNGDGLPDLAVTAELEDRPTNYAANSTWTANIDNTDGCPTGFRTDAGGLYIFAGARDGLVDPRPAFVLHGPETSDRIISVTGDLDINGDGIDDIVYGSYLRDEGVGGPLSNRGGVGVLFGRAGQDVMGKTRAICQPDHYFVGDRTNAYLGWSVTGLGDLNGDGCDEVVMGARLHGQEASNQGQVRVLYGWNSDGTTCAFSRPEYVALAPGLANSRAGSSVAGGVDADADGVPDLAVGGDSYRVDGNAFGGAWFVPGSYLRTLATEPMCSEAEIGMTEATYRCPACSFAAFNAGTCNPREAKILRSFAPTGLAEPYLVTGQDTGELFGTSVTLVPGVPGSTGFMGVGSPLSNINGEPRAGAAFLYAFSAGKLVTTRPYAVFGAEAGAVDVQFGAEMHSARVRGQAMWTIGAPFSSALGVNRGAVFAFPVPEDL